MPDVLSQAHSSTLDLTFYDADAFPAEYRGDAFAVLHGTWNREKRTGYKIIRVLMKDGKPTGVYEDFMTGFVLDEVTVWGRPAGIAVAKDGALPGNRFHDLDQVHLVATIRSLWYTVHHEAAS